MTAKNGAVLPSSRRALASVCLLLAALLGVTGGGLSAGGAEEPDRRQARAEQGRDVRPPAAAPAAAPAVAAKQRRPNIVLITTDDQTDTDMSAMPRTRRQLADKGVDFVRAISPHPLCCPARASLLTGQYAHNNGVEHNDGPYGGWDRFRSFEEGVHLRRNLGTYLQDAGYTTGFIGKMLNGYAADRRRPRGWDLWDPTLGRTYAFVDTDFENDGDPETPKGYIADVMADRADRFLRRASERGRPFFLWASHVAPHDGTVNGRFIGEPIPAPRHRDLHRKAKPPSLKRSSFNEEDVSDKPRYLRRRTASRKDMTHLHRQRLRSLAAVDEANAAMLRRLKKLGELEDTLVVFTSDNGFLLGEHRLRGKNFPYEENLQVPLLVRGPGLDRGVRSTAPASIVDLPATFLDAAGVWETASQRRRVDGASLLPAARGAESTGLSGTALVQAGTSLAAARKKGHGWLFRGVRTARYTYVRHHTGEVELYDRDVDPHQVRNLVHVGSGKLTRRGKEYADVLAELKRRLRALDDCRGSKQCEKAFGPTPDPGS